MANIWGNMRGFRVRRAWPGLRLLAVVLVGIVPLPGEAASSWNRLAGAAPSKTTQTTSGRWSSVDSAAVFEREIRRNTQDSGLGNLAYLEFLTPSGLAPVKPVLETRSDLHAMLLGSWTPVGDRTLVEMHKAMQVIVDIPSTLDDDRFKPIREATSPACKRSAHDYLLAVGKLDQSENIPLSARSPDVIAKSEAYDRDCLTPLANVPVAVRQVTGILLTTDSVPFCSATSVGRALVITAKHCFFDPASGKPNDQFRELAANQVSYHTLDPQSGNHIFTVRAGKGAVASGAFDPSQDFVLLTVTDGPLPHFAAAVANPTPANAAPVPTWIVGLNTLVADIQRSRPATSFVRGSSPKGCSVVEVPASGCLVHSCQTAPGTSGAGVIEIRPAGPVLIGVHVTSSIEASACGVNAPVGGMLNLAASITSASLTP